MSYSPPAADQAGGDLETGYTPPHAWSAGGDLLPLSETDPSQPMPWRPRALAMSVVVARLDDPEQDRAHAGVWWSDVPYRDDHAGVVADVRIVSRVSYDRRASVRFWSRSRSRPGVGSIDLAALDGALDWLLWGDVRDRRVDIYLGTDDAPLDQLVRVATAVVDSVETDGHGVIRLVLADTAAVLDRPITGRLYASGPMAGQAAPFALGTCRSVPLLQPDPPQLVYDVHDDAAASVSLVRDQGVELDEGDDWVQPDYDVAPHHVELLQAPVGRLVADIAGAELAREYVLDEVDGDLSAPWGGPTPPGWTVTAIGGPTVTEVSGVGARIFYPGPSFTVSARLTAPGSLPADPVIVEVDVVETVAGAVELWEDAGLSSARLIRMLAPGPNVMTVERQGTGVLSLVAVLGADARMDMTIARMVVYRRVVVPGGGSATSSLRGALEYLLLDRGGWPAELVDWASVDAIDALGYSYGYWTAQPVAVTEILDALADSWCGWWTIDRLGRVRLGALELDDDAEPVLRLSDADLLDDVDIVRDWAPGLARVVLGGRNWHVHGPSELAGAVQGTVVGVELQQRYAIRREGLALPSWIAAAATRAGYRRDGRREDEPGMATLLQDAEAVEAVAEYATQLYQRPRHWVRMSVAIEAAAAAALEPGDVIEMSSDRYWSGEVRRLTVIEVRGEIGRSRVDLVCWGAVAPEDD